MLTDKSYIEKCLMYSKQASYSFSNSLAVQYMGGGGGGVKKFVH